MRKFFHGLAAMVKYCMEYDVLNGDIYIFLSKGRNSIKLLSFEGYGFALYYQKIERGTFEMPAYDTLLRSIAITDAELIMVLKGIVLKTANYHRRYERIK